MTSPKEWSRVRAIFEAVVELPDDEREPALAQRCGEDAELSRAVRALIDADRSTRLGGLEPSTGAFERLCSSIGSVDSLAIEGFTVIRLIASGGMGAVYEAEQSSPRRPVALKVLRPELCSGSTLERFRVEAEILARLHHPGIAEVHAAGVQRVRSGPFEFDLPWYALELLTPARSLTDHARLLGLDRQARIELLRRVCEAIHHAHLRGVIHRDLKPANILVSEDGSPKIVDFGIARLVGSPDAAALTAPGVVMGTPAYMAPEQRRADPDLDLRCDVFALGVILFELLVDRLQEGAAPREDLSLRASLPDADEELDWIVGMATAAEPSRRYASAAAMADDLLRHLRREAVQAAPPSRVYRLRKLVRRHRVALSTTLIVFLALAGGLTASLIALDRARAAEALAESERGGADKARAVAEAALAESTEQEQISTGVAGVFKSAVLGAIGRAQGRDTTIADLCSEMATMLDDSSQPPLMRGSVANLLATTAFANGDHRGAVEFHRRSVACLAEAGKTGTVDDVLERGNLVDALRIVGDREGYERELGIALELATKLGPDHQVALQIEGRRVIGLLDRGDFDAALELARHVLDARLRVLGPDHPETVDARIDEFACLQSRRDFDGALPVGRETFAEIGRVLGPHHWKSTSFGNRLVVLFVQRGEYREAVDFGMPLVEVGMRSLPPAHPDLLELETSIAAAMQRGGIDLPRGAELIADALGKRRERLAATHPDVTRSARLLARIELLRGRPAAAVEALEPCLESFADCAPVLRAGVFDAQMLHAEALVANGSLDRAREDLARVRAEVEATLTESDAMRAQFSARVEQILHASAESHGASTGR